MLQAGADAQRLKAADIGGSQFTGQQRILRQIFKIASAEDMAFHVNTMAERNVNYLGSEVVFDSEDAPVAGREYIERMHRMGKLIWCNGILYDYREPLSAGHSDDVSMLDDPEKGWGWLADRGYDIIQTDFLLPCRQFLENTGRRRKV